MDIELIECFKTWQGEGPNTGSKMLLTRFQKCQLRCPFCDTMIKMTSCIPATYKADSLNKIVVENQLGLMITGGEPTMPGQNIDSTIFMLNNFDYSMANVETNGGWLLKLLEKIDSKNLPKIKIMWSPKFLNHPLFESNLALFREIEKVYEKLIYFKLVINEDDSSANMTLTRTFLDLIASRVRGDHIYLMPMGQNIMEMEENAKTVFDLAELYSTNVSTRMHLIYNFV